MNKDIWFEIGSWLGPRKVCIVGQCSKFLYKIFYDSICKYRREKKIARFAKKFLLIKFGGIPRKGKRVFKILKDPRHVEGQWIIDLSRNNERAMDIVSNITLVFNEKPVGSYIYYA